MCCGHLCVCAWHPGVGRGQQCSGLMMGALGSGGESWAELSCCPQVGMGTALGGQGAPDTICRKRRETPMVQKLLDHFPYSRTLALPPPPGPEKLPAPTREMEPTAREACMSQPNSPPQHPLTLLPRNSRPFGRLWFCARVGTQKALCFSVRPGTRGWWGPRESLGRGPVPQARAATQWTASALRCPPSQSGAAMCAPALCGASVLPASTAAGSLPSGPVPCAGALGPGQVPRLPRKVRGWECRWKLAPELTLHRPRTAAPCCTGAPHVHTWGRRSLPLWGTTDGASPRLILVVLHPGTPSAPARWEAGHAVLHQLLSLPFSWLWHVCV